MSRLISGRLPVLRRPRTWRIGSGLVLFAYVTTHLLNHALGIVSLAAMEAGGAVFRLFWQSPPGTLALYAALVVHIVLALWSIWRRRTLRMPPAEAVQLAFGLLIPILLIPHLTGTRGIEVLGGLDPGYPDIVRILWFDPVIGSRQLAGLLVVWVHGCLGVHMWRRHRDGYERALPLLTALALLVPALALTGFLQAGKEVAGLVAAGTLPPMVLPPAVAETLTRLHDGAYALFITAVAVAFGLRGVRVWLGRHALVHVAYPGGQLAAVPRGTSVLEASRMAGIPHLSVCGGRGRCSTCRVRVAEGLESLPPPAEPELATLARIAAAPDVRLACQLRPAADLAVIPLLPAPAVSGLGPRPQRTQGQEAEIAVLFCDLRGFTALAERRLPFDTVYLLNRYFATAGLAVERSGGRVDKFIGDGMMALFGTGGDRDRGCRQAINAAARIAEGLEALNRAMAGELERPLRVAMGLHAGPAIIGEMGYGRATSFTAIGDSVNVASRLESIAKELNAELVVSAPVAEWAGCDLAGHEVRELPVRGRHEPIRVHVVTKAADLARSGDG